MNDHKLLSLGGYASALRSTSEKFVLKNWQKLCITPWPVHVIFPEHGNRKINY